jgi:hypothetical protein
MNRLVLGLTLALLTSTAFADLRAPQRTLQPVTDPSMVVMDRGAKLEVLPTERATISADSSGRLVHHMTHASGAAPIGPHQLGVVFNHAMQQQGYITGEIAFKVKDGHTFSGSPALYPGLKEITKPAVYVVNARTPAEFIKVLKRLQARSDLDWVEPTITYGATLSVEKPAAQQ